MDLMTDGVFQEHKLGSHGESSCGKRMEHFMLQTRQNFMKRTLGQEPTPCSAFLEYLWLKSPEELSCFSWAWLKAALLWPEALRAFTAGHSSALYGAGWKSCNIPDASRASSCSVLKQIHPWARGCQPQLCKGVLKQGVWRIVQLIV